MITLPSKFAAENAKAEKMPAVIVKLLESELSNEQTTQADWTANSGESNVDYTTTPGDVTLALQADSYTAGATNTARYDHTAVNMGGVMYVAGGVANASTPKDAINSFAKYTISTNTWTALPNLSVVRTGHVAVGDGGSLMYMGGGRSTRDFDTAAYLYQDWLSYNINTGAWTTLAALPQRIFDSAAAYLNGKIYLAGGRTDNGTSLSTFYVYDIATNTWSSLASMPRTFDRHSMVAWPGGGTSGQLIVYGGAIYSPAYGVTDETWIYDIATNAWSQSVSGATPRFAHAAAIIEDRMFIIGGKYTSGGYKNDLWELDLSAGVWYQRTGITNPTARLTAVPNGTDIVLHGGLTDTHTVSGGVSVYHIRLYQSTGWIQTQTMDLGAVPAVDGEVVLKDVRPAGTSITYEAWKSATGAFAGEEVYLGTITDGQIITAAQAARWYRVKATLNADTGRLFAPSVQSIKAVFATYRSFATATGFGYEPAVMGMSSLTTTIDTFKESSIGQMTVKMAFIQTISDFLATKYPKNKVVKILVGFVAEGFTEADFIEYFQGAIVDWSISNKDEVSLTLHDFKTEWDVPVPASWQSTLDDVTWTAMHHADVILDILQNHVNVRDSKIDIASFDALKAALPNWKVTRTITGNTEQAYTLIEELRVLMSAFFIPRADGKISIKRFDPTEAAVLSLSDNTKFNAQWEANAGALINDVFIYSDHDGNGSDTSNFADLRIGVDVASQVNYDEDAVKVIKDKWTRQSTNNMATNGGFENGSTSGWALGLNTADGASAVFSVVAASPPWPGSWKGNVAISNGGNSVDDVRLSQTGMSITAGHKYRIRFGVATSVNYSMEVRFHKSGSLTTSYAIEAVQTVAATPTYTVFEVVYTAAVTATDLDVSFYMGLGPTTVQIDYLSIMDVNDDQTGDLMGKILGRYATPPEVITVDTDANTIALEVGDIVDITTLRAPSTDMSGVNALRAQVVNRNMDFTKNRNRLKLLRV